MSKIHMLDKNTPSFVSKSGNLFVAFLDGEAISSIEEFYTAVAKALHFPDYFGRNMDALEEMLNDLEWIKEESFLLIIKNADDLLKGKSGEKAKIIDLIQLVDNPRFEICFV